MVYQYNQMLDVEFINSKSCQALIQPVELKSKWGRFRIQTGKALQEPPCYLPCLLSLFESWPLFGGGRIKLSSTPAWEHSEIWAKLKVIHLHFSYFYNAFNHAHEMLLCQSEVCVRVEAIIFFPLQFHHSEPTKLSFLWRCSQLS